MAKKRGLCLLIPSFGLKRPTLSFLTLNYACVKSNKLLSMVDKLNGNLFADTPWRSVPHTYVVIKTIKLVTSFYSDLIFKNRHIQTVVSTHANFCQQEFYLQFLFYV